MLELAQANISQFCYELGLECVRIGRVSAIDRGHYHCFTLLNGEANKPYTGKFCYIEVPGIELDMIKSANLARANPLYVDGSVWYWRLALEIAKDLLLRIKDDEILPLVEDKRE